jgi:hypothetical protein
MYRRNTFTVKGLEPHLGVLLPIAYADLTKRVREAPENDDRGQGKGMLVVAKTWKVAQFQTLITYAGGIPETGFTATASSGFTFRLEPKLSEGAHSHFLYPWFGHFVLYRLQTCSAYIPSSQAKTTPVYCGDVLVGNQAWKWQNLQTSVGGDKSTLLNMSPDDTQLQDHDELTTPAGTTKRDWTFQADVVYSH